MELVFVSVMIERYDLITYSDGNAVVIDRKYNAKIVEINTKNDALTRKLGMIILDELNKGELENEE